MKKIKRIMAMLLAMVMVLGMTVTAYAAKGGATINVTGLSTNGTQKVTIYEIYRLDANDNSWVKAAWVPTVVTPDNLDQVDMLVAMKEAALQTTGVGVSQESENGSVIFNNVQSGAYLVLAVDESGKVTYNTMVAKTYKYDGNSLIAPDTANVVAKAETYTTDKKQNDTDSVVEVGDLVEYSITTTVPYQDGSVTEFSVNDELTGATYYLTGDAVKGASPINNIKVNGVNKPDLKIDEEYHGQTTFTVDLMSLVNDNNTNAGATVVITYTAKVNAVDEVTNKADSSHDSDGTTVHAYTGRAEITKYAEDTNNNDLSDNAKLAGAQFALYRLSNDSTTREYAVIDTNGYITGEWITVAAVDGKYTLPDNVSTVTTNNEGIATVKGLNVGTYYFDEVVAPDGYAINEADRMVEVEVGESGSTILGSTYMIDSTLSSLPETGGIGTTIFTIGGCVIMIAAAGLFFASRRKSAK